MTGDKHVVISNASCAYQPLSSCHCQRVDEKFGIIKMLTTTTHTATLGINAVAQSPGCATRKGSSDEHSQL